MSKTAANKLKQLIKASKSAFAYTALFSCLVNILMLTVPLYMLQLFDRVIASQSYETLLYLTLIAIIALLILSLLDIIRGRILVRTGQWLDQKLSPLALKNSLDNYLLGGNYGKQCLSDVASLRQFLSSSSVFAFFDAPWIIIYLLVIYLLSVTLGLIATLGAILLTILAVLNEYLSRDQLKQASAGLTQGQRLIEDTMNNAESTQALGMLDNIISLWDQTQQTSLQQQTKATDRSSSIIAISKFIRMSLQIIILGTGAYLTIQGQLTAGAMIAASIIMGRALAPIEQAMGAWKAFFNTYQAYQRLTAYFETPSTRFNSIALPKPDGVLKVENVSFAPQKGMAPILQNINFTLTAGHTLAIIGPTGAGKSTLARLLVGIWPPTLGAVRLDGAEIYHWEQTEIGKHIGYSSQTLSLFDSTIKHNIARLGTPNDNDIITAAKLINIHQQILQLPKSYETNVKGYEIPVGLKQRIALARAFYQNPSLVVLDEPESHLDQAGLVSLTQTLKQAKQLGISIVLITQRPNLASLADKIMILNQGKIQNYGNAAEIMKIWQGNSDEPKQR